LGLLLRRTKLILINRQNIEEEEQIGLFGYLIEIPISFPLLSPSVLLLTGLWLWQIHGKQELPPIGKKMEEARRGGGAQGAAEAAQE
jgi:hypothetical protein